MRTASSARALVATLIAGCLLPSGASAQAPAQGQADPALAGQADEPLPSEAPGVSAGAAAFDVLVLRPLGFVVIPVGVAAFIPAAITTAPNGLDSVQTALEFFVTNPTNYVFKRPLGEF
jgi:hypothetical protein